MRTSRRNFLSLLCVCALPVVASSCECDHNLEEPYPFKLGWVVCTDGQVMSFCDYTVSDKEAIAIVYNVVQDHESPITGYAVYLNDLEVRDEDGRPMQQSARLKFSESIDDKQGTSADVSALDGNENTFAMHTSEVESPLAESVFDIWKYGQSAYIPSVAQLRQIYAVKDYINPRIEAIGGDVLPDDPDECWYWSSTEVSGQETAKSWLFSMQSGSIQETPKNQGHKCRPVITLYK
ncbi:MAG: DUF1566 domain-containing protein [Muribaculum sp.]|nr:DUF1566 domain-containing protein [Muribaculum sp.]